MHFDFTKNEQQELEIITEEYKKNLAEIDKILDSSWPDKDQLKPDREMFFKEAQELTPANFPSISEASEEDFLDFIRTPEYQVYIQAHERAAKLYSVALIKWEQSGPPEWKEAQEARTKARYNYAEAVECITRKAEQRYLNSFSGESLVAEAKRQAKLSIEERKGYFQEILSQTQYPLKYGVTELFNDCESSLLPFAERMSEEHIRQIIQEAIDQADFFPREGDHFIIRPQKRNYRTRAKAQESGACSKIPSAIATPTLSPYQFSMSFCQEEAAYLQPLVSTNGLKFQDGKMFFKDMRQVSEVELQNLKTKAGIESINLDLLRIFYSIILSEFVKSDYTRQTDVLTLYLPDLAECLGLPRNLNKEKINDIIQKAQSFHNIVGVLYEERNGKKSKSLYPVLNFEGFSSQNNTISINSPYMNHVIQTVFRAAVKRDPKSQNPLLSKAGTQIRLPSHTFLIHSSIAKQKNKAAIENVILIVMLIERTGDNIPHIKASRLIERNPFLQLKIETNPGRKTQILNRDFSKTWELLRTETDLLDAYPGIDLPDPKDPTKIPTSKTVDSMVFYFPHHGKKKN